MNRSEHTARPDGWIFFLFLVLLAMGWVAHAVERRGGGRREEDSAR